MNQGKTAVGAGLFISEWLTAKTEGKWKGRNQNIRSPTIIKRPCTHHRDGNGPRGAVGVWVRRDQVAHVER
jgi:hypothetical protein